MLLFQRLYLKLDKRSINFGLQFEENNGDILEFSRKIKLLKFKENEAHSGFAQVGFIILKLLFSDYKSNKEILNECLHIYFEEDENKVIYKLYDEKKKFMPGK